MIYGEGDFSGSIKEDCALRNRSLTQMSLSQGRGALQCDRLRNAQSVIDTIVGLRPKHENNSFPKYSGGVRGSHSSATDCATRNQSLIQSSRKTRIVCGICDAAVALECDPPVRDYTQYAIIIDTTHRFNRLFVDSMFILFNSFNNSILCILYRYFSIS